MKKIKLGYYKQFGRTELETACQKWQKMRSDYKLELRPLSRCLVEKSLLNGKIDFGLSDMKPKSKSLKVQSLATYGLVIVVAKGLFPQGQQTVNVDSLKKMTDILVAEPQEERSAIAYQRQYLGLKNKFLAVNEVDEASLMAASASGFFVMNEKTVQHLHNPNLQFLFLLRKQQQLWQHYYLLEPVKRQCPVVLIKILKANL